MTTLQHPTVAVPMEGGNAERCVEVVPSQGAMKVRADPASDELHLRAGFELRLGGKPIRVLAAGMLPVLIYVLIHFFLR